MIKMVAMYTPVFNKIRSLLFPTIIDLLAERKKLKEKDIGEIIYKLKKENPKKFELIDFAYKSECYSEEIDDALFDMVRHYLIDRSSNGYYELTRMGLRCIGKEFKEMP